jgi:hypothetical protein
MEEVDAEISEMKLFLNGRARFVAEGYLAQVIHLQSFTLIVSSHSLYYGNSYRMFYTLQKARCRRCDKVSKVVNLPRGQLYRDLIESCP